MDVFDCPSSTKIIDGQPASLSSEMFFLQDYQTSAQLGVPKMKDFIGKFCHDPQLLKILQRMTDMRAEQQNQRIAQIFKKRILSCPQMHRGLALGSTYKFLSNHQKFMKDPIPFSKTNVQREDLILAQPDQKQNCDASNSNQTSLKPQSVHDLFMHKLQQKQAGQTMLEEAKGSKETNIARADGSNVEPHDQVSMQLIQKRKLNQKEAMELGATNLHPLASNQQPKKRKKRVKRSKRLTKWWYEPKMREKMQNAIAAVRVEDQSLQLVSATHQIPPRTLSRYVKASFVPDSPFFVGQDKWRSKPFKVGQIRTCIAAMNIDGLGIQKASALYNVPHFALTRYLKESQERRESPFYFQSAPPTSKHGAYLDRVKEAIRCHRQGFYGSASLGQLLSLLYDDCIDKPADTDHWHPRDGGPAMLRPLLIMVESLPEILTNVILTLRFYLFQEAPTQSPGGRVGDERVAKLWLRTAPWIYGQKQGTILNDLVATILVAMRKHTSRACIQILCLETLDRLSSSLPDAGVFGHGVGGSRHIAGELVTSYGLLTAEEAAVITAMAAHSAKLEYGECSLKDRHRVETGPLDLSCAYPCNDPSTRRFFGGGWADRPSIYDRWANKEYKKTKPATTLQTEIQKEESLVVGDMTRLLDPPMTSVWLAAKYRRWDGDSMPDKKRAKKGADSPLRQLAMVCCETPTQSMHSKTSDVRRHFVC